MRTDTIETWVWVLIYGGLIAVGLGLAVRHALGGLSQGLLVLGAVSVATGVVLIVVRSRMSPNDPQDKE
jgi:hypothetical protein